MRLSPFLFSQNIATDNAINTIQCIHQLIGKINDVVDYVNSLELDSNQYTDTKIEELKNMLEVEIDSLDVVLKQYTDNSISTLSEDTDNKITLLYEYVDNHVESIFTTITNLNAELRQYVKAEDDKIYVKIDEVYNKLYDLILNGNSIVFSPLDGILKNLQLCFDDVTKMMQRVNSVTIGELEELWLGESVKINDILNSTDIFKNRASMRIIDLMLDTYNWLSWIMVNAGTPDAEPIIPSYDNYFVPIKTLICKDDAWQD